MNFEPLRNYIDQMPERGIYGCAIRVWKDQLNEIQKRDFARRFGLKGYSYGLGVRTLIDASKSKSPKGEFGWDGAAGAWVMIDPQNHLAAFYVQHVLDCGKAYKEYHPQIRNLIYDGIQG